MSAESIQLIDAGGRLLAVARVIDEGRHFGGTIDLTATPADVLAIFEEFDELVNTQQFICADEIEARIDALAIRAVFEDGTAKPATDLQVFPSTGDVSFKVAEVAALNGAPSPARKPQRS